jgi:hypothetical protein
MSREYTIKIKCRKVIQNCLTTLQILPFKNFSTMNKGSRSKWAGSVAHMGEVITACNIRNSKRGSPLGGTIPNSILEK